jgi:hypothetical protein
MIAAGPGCDRGIRVVAILAQASGRGDPERADGQSPTAFDGSIIMADDAQLGGNV